jgi:hypothetical protein
MNNTSNATILKMKKIVIPGINVKDLSPLASLVSPKELVITMSLISILSQISDNLRNNLELKDIQNIPSVNFYSKIINNSTSTVSLTTLFSMSKSLGPELEILSSMNTTERLHFLYLLKKSIINEKVAGRISSKSRMFNDPFELLRYRKGLSLQSRSIMLATAIFLPHSIVLGLSINQINIDWIITSAQIVWSYWGLSLEEFEYLLRKEALCYLKTVNRKNDVTIPATLKDSIRILFLSTIREFTFFEDKLIFNEDNVLLKSNENLTLLEKEFGFINRPFPNLPDNISNFDYDLEDKLIRVAFNQRKDQVLQINSIFKHTK